MTPGILVRVGLVVRTPFPVGTSVWQSGSDRWNLTVFAKATYALVHGGKSDLSPQQVPIAPRDRAPSKTTADIVVVGHAHAAPDRPVQGVLTRLRIGDLERALRVERVDGSIPELGPREPGWPEDIENDDDARSWARRFASDQARFDGPPPEAFDFEIFSIAPQLQRPAALQLESAIVLEHLHPTELLLATRLRLIRPRARRIHPKTGDAHELLLAADTLWVDADDGTVSVVWRGVTPLGSAPDDVGDVVVTMESAQEGKSVSPSAAPEAGSRHPLDQRHDSVRARSTRTGNTPRTAPLPPLMPSGDTLEMSPVADEDRAAAVIEGASTLADEATTEPLYINLLRCAEIEARLSARADKRAAVLHEEKLSEDDWTRMLEKWTSRVQQECQQGITLRRQRYDDAFTTKLEEHRGPFSPELGARIIVATERGELSELTSDLSLSIDELLKVDRALSHRAAGDEKRQRETTLEVARLRGGESPPGSA